MLYPQSNKFRSTTSLNGIWNYKTVDDDYKPVAKATGASPMAVPASINDIVTDKNRRIRGKSSSKPILRFRARTVKFTDYASEQPVTNAKFILTAIKSEKGSAVNCR
ncbi:MAG: hypothetical protein ACLUSP_05880 [Christensenellales bacterium]